MLSSLSQKLSSTFQKLCCKGRIAEVGIARRGQGLYNQIRQRVEAEYKGQFFVVEVHTGDGEIDVECHAALKRIQARHPDGAFFLIRIGDRAAYTLSGILRVEMPIT